MHLLRFFVFAVAASPLSTAFAVDTTMTPAGYTGLGITPNAHLLGWGRTEASYDNQLPGIVQNPQGHNYVLGFGLLPNLEVSGRLAANELHSNCFTENCGARDLSASVKGGIGLDAAGRFRVAGGVTDIGGAVTYFRTYYGVLTYNEGPVEVSAGLARRTGSGINGSRSPLDGPFAAASWTPFPWIRGQIEYSDRNAWAGVRLFAPKEWLPEGWTAYIGATQRLTESTLTQRSWWTAGISIPLYKVPDLPGNRAKAPLPELAGTQLPAPVYEARTLPPPPSPQVAAPSPSPAAVTTDQLDALAAELKAKGLEDISVGRMPDGSVALRANNASYNWNSADAVGAALGAVARTLGSTPIAYRLILTQRQVPLVAVTGQANCLKEWIANQAATCTAGELSTPGTGPLDPLHRGAAWHVSNLQPSWKTLRVRLSPVLRTNVGSEVGVLDYSAGVNVGLELPLWAGARVEWRRNVPVDNSSDYERGALFGARRVKAETERLAFTQTLRLPLEAWLAPGDDAKARRWGLAGVTAQATVGRVGSYFDGALGSIRWEPGEGRHRVTAQAGRFRHAEFGAPDAPGPRLATPVLASYRYNVTATRTFLEGTAGQFFNNDRGFQVGMRQWFGDVAVGVYYRRARFEGSPVRQFAGIELSLPIGPRREMAPAWNVQVTGTPRFKHGVETTLREPVGGNPVRTGFGVMPPAPSLEETFNSDRSGLAYFEDNVRRIRDAAR
jgi:hypothetical protein